MILTSFYGMSQKTHAIKKKKKSVPPSRHRLLRWVSAPTGVKNYET